MIPVIAIVGRPNVGKSTLFNYVTRSRQALVADQPGLTRDRQYGEGKFNKKPFIVVDTGGLTANVDGIDEKMSEQTMQAVHEADAVLFLVDAREGLTPSDEILVRELRKISKPINLVVNKTDGIDADSALSDFYRLGFADISPISAEHRHGVDNLFTKVLTPFVEEMDAESPEEQKGIKIAFVGRPNVGKSTLVNRILGEERVVVFDQPGTTRDSIFVPFTRRERDYVLIDTAGVRRRSRIDERVEKFSVIKAFQAVAEANVVVLVIDARDIISEQDLRLLGFVLQAGRALVIAVNKWDGMTQYEREQTKQELDRRLGFVDFADIHFISALHGTGVGNIFASINASYRSATKQLATPLVTRILEYAVSKHEPPLVHGRRIKLRYAHAGGQNPPRIIVHGKQTDNVPEGYRRYLESVYRKELKLVGTPVCVEFRSDDNPFKGRKNTLTERQVQKKKRLIRHVKKNAR